MDGDFRQFDDSTSFATREDNDETRSTADQFEQWQGVKERFSQAISDCEIPQALTLLNYMLEQGCPQAILDHAQSLYFNAIVAAHYADARDAIEAGGVKFLGDARTAKRLALDYVNDAESHGIIINPEVRAALSELQVDY